MAYKNEPMLFELRTLEVNPEAKMFPTPTGERTKENMDAYNEMCVEWLKGVTKDIEYPSDIKRMDMTYQRGDYTGRAFVYRPDTDEKLPVIIHTHGGSYLFWSIEYYDLMCSWIAHEGHCVVVNLDFRMNIGDILIPDMLEDCYAGIKAVIEQADNYGIDPEKLGLMGDSSGASQAMGLTIMCRDRGEINVPYRILIAGGVGFDPEDLDNGNAYAKETSLMGAQNVVIRGFKSIEQSQHPWYTPWNDKHVELCPPTTFVVGTGDYMWHDVAIYSKRLLAAGVPVEIGLFAGMPHGFYNGTHEASARECWKFLGEQIKKHLA